jgi:lysozyme
MNKNFSTLILGIIIVGLTIITITQTDFIPRVKNKLFLNPSKETSTGSRNEMGEIYGIDVSHHQKNINWSKVKYWSGNKIQFVYVKATEGGTYIDKNYQQNIKGARSNNLLVGSYHYFRTSSSVEDQFKNFINNVDKSKQDLIPLVDVEEKRNWNDSEFHKNFQEFLDMVENHFGQKPMIYTVNSFYNRHLSGKYKSYHFLIGRYGENSPNMKDKSNWTIWQFSEKGKIDGIPKPVDIDVINKTYSLQDLLLKE